MDKDEAKETSLKKFLPLFYLGIFVLGLRWLIVEPFIVPTGSMEPTLKPGDRLFAFKCAYNFRLPFTDIVLVNWAKVKKGDIILFKAPKDPEHIYVKRALAIPGDTIEFKEGQVFVNNTEVLKSEVGHDLPRYNDVMYDISRKDDKSLYIEDLFGVKHYVILDPEYPNLRSTEKILIPPGFIFAVGDNRDNSHDSRAWGFVPFDNLRGRALVIFFSSWNFIPRFERFGTIIR